MWCDVMWCDVMWCDVMWCDVMWCDVRWCDVMWCDVMWCDVMWCKVMDTIFWLSPTIESCNWIDFISVAYANWYHWNCGRTQRKAETINQLACLSYSSMFSCSGTQCTTPEGWRLGWALVININNMAPGCTWLLEWETPPCLNNRGFW